MDDRTIGPCLLEEVASSLLLEILWKNRLRNPKNQNSRNEQPYLANFMFNEIFFWPVFCALKPFFFLWECCLFNLLFYWTKNKNSADWPIFSDFGCRIRSFFSTNSIGWNKMKRLDLIEYKYQSVNH